MMMASRIPNFVFVLFVVILGLVAYFNSFSGQFVWDDTLLIAGNQHIKDARFIGKIFTEDLFYMSDLPTGYYRPLQTVSYMADYFLWGKEPFGYHVTNFILQVLNSTIIFYLALLLLGNRWKAFFVAAIFCVHPAFAAIVTYISGRADLLGFFFSLLVLYAVIRYIVLSRGAVTVWLSIPLYIFAVISKEYYLITPLFILLFLFAYREKHKPDMTVKTILTALSMVAIVYVILRSTALNFHQEMGIIARQPFLTRLAIFPWTIAKYIGTLILPIDLGMEKRLVYESLFEARFVVSYAVVIIIVWALYRFNKARRPEPLFFLGWFVLGIIPLSNLFVPLKAILADHWTYVASVGIFGLVAALVDRVKNPMAMRLFALIATVFMAAMIGTTIVENRHWRSEDVLYARILLKNPDSSRTLYNMGRLYEESGDNEKAMRAYTEAIEKSAGNKGQYLNARGLLHKKMGDIEKAKDDFEATVKVAPSVAVYHNNLGCSYAELKMVDRARAEWKEALKIDPDDKLARKNLEVAGPS